MGAKLGLSAKLYRLSTGSRASWGTADANGMAAAAAPANLDECVQVKSANLTIEKGQADVSTRGNNGWKANLGTLKDASIEINMVYDDADADYIALMKSFLTNTPIALAALSGDKATAGVQGLWADMDTLSANKTEDLEEGQMMQFTCKPALTSVAPEWIKVV